MYMPASLLSKTKMPKATHVVSYLFPLCGDVNGSPIFRLSGGTYPLKIGFGSLFRPQ